MRNYSKTTLLLYYASPLIAAEGYFFCLETKEAKIQVRQKGFFAAQGLYPASSQNHGLQNLAPTSFARWAYPSGKYCHALATAQALHCSAYFHPKLFC